MTHSPGAPIEFYDRLSRSWRPGTVVAGATGDPPRYIIEDEWHHEHEVSPEQIRQAQV